MTDEEPVLLAYRATVRPLYAWVSRRVGGDRALAEDVVQECWLRAAEAWRRSGPPDDPLAWLSTVAANLVRSHYRKRAPVPLGSGRAGAAALDLAGEDLAPRTPDAAALLHWGLGRLGAGQARLLVRRHLDGARTADLARELGLTERAIEGRLRRSRAALARHLAPFLDPS